MKRIYLALTAVLVAGLLLNSGVSVIAQGNDHDGDGLAEGSDVDDDGDGFPDCKEKDIYKLDHDNDGIKDADDADDDGDGTGDGSDSQSLDADNDGTSDAVENRLINSDSDRDRDGILDRVEKKKWRRDHDNDGKKDFADRDDDNDGVRDGLEPTADRRDHDNDGFKDKKDLDDDNDGLNDFDEAACNAWFDADNDGIPDKEETEGAVIEVDIDSFAFSPSSVTISAGDTVRWTNNDSVAHTITSDDHTTFDSGTLGVGDIFEYTFTSAEIVTYHCDFHPLMTAQVVVE